MESSDWVSIAVHVVQAILEGVRRNQSGDHNAHALVYASGLREAVKATTGAPPKSLDETDWCLGPTGRTHWSRERSPRRYVFNAHRGFSLIEIRQAPAALPQRRGPARARGRTRQTGLLTKSSMFLSSAALRSLYQLASPMPPRWSIVEIARAARAIASRRG